MTDYAKLQDSCLTEASEHCTRSRNYAAFNGTSIILTALLAAGAAVTSAASAWPWITTVSAALSAALGIVIAGFKPKDKAATHIALAADLKRLASRYGQLDELTKSGIPLRGNWLDALDEIQARLNKDEPITDEADWAAARVSAPANV